MPEGILDKDNSNYLYKHIGVMYCEKGDRTTDLLNKPHHKNPTVFDKTIKNPTHKIDRSIKNPLFVTTSLLFYWEHIVFLPRVIPSTIDY